VTAVAPSPATEASVDVSSGRRPRHLLEVIERCASRPWASYLAVFLVQLKVVWGAWIYRDLTEGDTGSYFILAELWLREHKVNFAWSPLYTVLYGSLVDLTPGDAYLPTIALRLVIVFAATFLVLAVMRRLLTPGLALLVTLWWALLPVTFDTMYELHLFGTLPVLACWAVILGGKGMARRGAALAILAVGALLVRNELVVGVVALAALCVLGEIRARRTPGLEGPPRAAEYLKAYGVPMLLAAGLCWAAHWRSTIQLPALWEASRPKHTINMCQSYSFGYQQRHPESTGDPMAGCRMFMRRDFGQDLPTFREMLRANPRAVATHFAWNASLAVNGVQTLLFATMSGTVTPDYIPVPTNARRATALSILAAALALAGAVALVRGRHGLDRWLADRVWGWLAILAMVPVWTAIILTQRPRPSYLLTLGAALMAALGTSALLTVWMPITRRMGRIGPWALMALVTALLAWWPSHYVPADQPMLTLYRRLLAFEDLIARPDTVLLVSSRPLELHYYLGRAQSKVLEYGPLVSGDEQELEAFLDQAGVNVFYADESMLETLRKSGRFDALLDSVKTPQWRLIGAENHGGARWRLWQRRGPAAPAQ